MTRKIGLVDNDPFTLAALRSVLADMSSCTVAWAVRSALEALELCAGEATRPDVLVTDVSMPDMNGITLCRLIRSATPQVPILAITSYNLDVYAMQVAAAGAQGIVNKDDPMTITAAVAAVGSGAVWPYKSNGNGRSMAVRFRTAEQAYGSVEASPAAQAIATLSAKELAVVRLTCETLGTFAELASQLGCSESTVKTLAQRAYRKLGVSNKRELMALWNEGIMA
ncbi:response regulator transcription factor [Bifidobacterium oedipodis]|uniref:DNA-binding response regulator n=1 Tax=Bifidobacterium oedipodis TaxID=2675322 RepID=A0A7Y0EQN9_9BIFI|nr:response regulator transcription factor [Bifidobacterium sp. DSM 109957]NMM94228.1 DNA-binding response regulator [Bifidobacterium sp. DSM 109957]